MARPSLSAVDSGVSPPSAGRSSLLQLIGLIPIFTSNGLAIVLLSTSLPWGSAELLLLGRFVLAPRLAHVSAVGYFGHGHVPPAATLGGGAAMVGVDGNQIGAGSGAGAAQRLFEFGNAVHVLGFGTHGARMRREV